MKPASASEEGDQFITFGVTDFIMSVAIIFVLLFILALQSANYTPASADSTTDAREPVQTHLERLGLPIEKDPEDQQVLLLVMPEELLNFEFGRATLRPAGAAYLQDSIPRYASALCGPLHDVIESVTIEGHTDDVGDDRSNLRLSQERAFQVMSKALEILEGRPEADCFQRITSASGRGKQDLWYDVDNRPNRDRSRRVVFKIRLRSTASPEGSHVAPPPRRA
jgi:outer membrane protein OmpA-like peptidoglycan-associated protein